jgi:hypothetical protein
MFLDSELEIYNDLLKNDKILLQCTELVREDCGEGTDYSLYQTCQWWISGLVIIHLFCATELV